MWRTTCVVGSMDARTVRVLPSTFESWTIVYASIHGEAVGSEPATLPSTLSFVDPLSDHRAVTQVCSFDRICSVIRISQHLNPSHRKQIGTPVQAATRCRTTTSIGCMSIHLDRGMTHRRYRLVKLARWWSVSYSAGSIPLQFETTSSSSTWLAGQITDACPGLGFTCGNGV